MKISSLALALFGIIGIPQLTLADQRQVVIDAIIANANEATAQCRSETPPIDVDPALAVITMGENSLFEMQVNPEGKMATVIYNEFSCSLGGYNFCGSGGCGYHIIVDGIVFERGGGYPPFSITDNDRTFIVMPIHASGCKDSNGQSGSGTYRCVNTAIWDDERQTFVSRGGEIYLSNLLD